MQKGKVTLDNLAESISCIALQKQHQISPAQIQHLVTTLNQLSIVMDVSSYAARLDLARAAAPVISRCLRCSRMLTNVVNERGPTLHEFGAQALQGNLYVSIALRPDLPAAWLPDHC